MTPRDFIKQNVDTESYEAEFIISDCEYFSLTQQFDEAMDMLGWCGLEFMNATIFYECDDVKVELAWVVFDELGVHEDGFTYGFAEDTLKTLRIKWK